MSETPSPIEADLDAHELEQVQQTNVPLSEWRSRNPIELIEAWRAHVDKIDTDRTLSTDDHSAWVAHDLVAALSMRDFVDDARHALPPELRAKIDQHLTDIDDHWHSITEHDPHGKAGTIAELDTSTRGWWWHRIPTHGPMRDDIEHYVANTQAAQQQSSPPTQ